MPRLVHSAPARPSGLAGAGDDEIMRAVRRGDGDAFDELVRRKADVLFGVALRWIGEREEARDLTQLAFLRVWENRHRYDARFSPNTWLYRILTNLAIDALRARQARARRSGAVQHHYFRLVESRAEAPSRQVLEREVWTILRDLASSLSERQRLAFVLREVEELSSAEVARILGCRRSTVRNHLFQARKKLRQELARRFPEYARPVPGGR